MTTNAQIVDVPQIIALFTDFGTRDAYVAQMKGAILSINPRALLVDLTHEISPYDIREASYILRQATAYLPSRTIVVAVIDPGVGSHRRGIVLRTKLQKAFIGPDNGIFSRVMESEELLEAYCLQEERFFLSPTVSPTFHGRDIFGPAAAHLSLGAQMHEFGTKLTDLVTLPIPQLNINGRHVQGEVIHIDRFGNVVTNITVGVLRGLRHGHTVEATHGNAVYPMPFYTTYADGLPDQLICLFNSDGAFELALPQGQASTFLGLQVGDVLSIRT